MKSRNAGLSDVCLTARVQLYVIMARLALVKAGIIPINCYVTVVNEMNYSSNQRRGEG